MSNIIPFQNQQGMASLFQDMFGNTGVADDLTTGVGLGFPYLSFKGKTFKIVDGQNEEVLYSVETPGMPAQYIDVVILKASRFMAKTFYLNGWSDDAHAPPDCSSINGVEPDPGVPARQNNVCASCQWNEWGSRVNTSDGTESKGKACQDGRRTAVALIDALDDPMLIRIPPTSLKNLASHGAQLTKRGVPYQAVVTRIFFDHNESYPKLMFAAQRYINDEEARAVYELIGGSGRAPDPIIEQICGIVPVRQNQTIQPIQPPPQPTQPTQPAQITQQPQMQQPMQQPVAQQQPYMPPAGGMFDTPQQPRQTVQQAAPQPTQPAQQAQPEAPKRQRRARAAATQPAAPEQTAGVMPNGAAHAGVTVVNGDAAQGLDALLSGLPDIPNV